MKLWKIEYVDVDISSKVSSWEITGDASAFCRELRFSLADRSLYESFNFLKIPSSTCIRVYTRSLTDSEWIPQGRFFVERPDYAHTIHSSIPALWGRSRTAKLGNPFAVRLTRTWKKLTSAHSIIDWLCVRGGITFDPEYCFIPDFAVHPYAFSVDNRYPIEAITELAQLAYGEAVYITTDGYDHLVIRPVAFSPSPGSAVFTVSDATVSDLREEITLPDFFNRLKVSPAAIGGFSVTLKVEAQCLSADNQSSSRLFARLIDQDGKPLNGLPVTWSATGGLSLQSQTSTTGTRTVLNQQVRAKGYYEFELEYPPKQILGVYAYRDRSRTINLAKDGVTIEGTTVRLTSPLSYCDQLLRVNSIVEGVAVNTAQAGSQAGTATVTADVSGNADTQEIYVDNPCQCPPSIEMEATPSSINIGETAQILVYVEMAGAPVTDGRLAYMSIASAPAHGHLRWTRAKLGRVGIKNSRTSAVNDVEGVTQCSLRFFPLDVTGVWLADAEGKPTEANLYASHSGKLVNLNAHVATDLDLVADFTAVGAVLNSYDGVTAGTDSIRAWIKVAREEPVEASTSVTVSAESDPDEPPGECCEEGLCRADNVPCNSGRITAKKVGEKGCWLPEEADSCGEGKVYGYKQDVLDCWPIEECDPCESGSVYAKCKGVDGCWPPAEADPCGGGNIYCYKGGVLGCHPSGECDTGRQDGAGVACQAGSQCCVHKTSGLRGCWPSDQCSSDTGGGNEPYDEHPDRKCWTSSGEVECKDQKDENGKTIHYRCCYKKGKAGCYRHNECDDEKTGQWEHFCQTVPCQGLPSPDCMGSRFNKQDQLNYPGCDCEKLCQSEFEAYGTTQDYDGSSYRTIRELVEQVHQLEYGSPEYWEKYEELKQDALSSCRQACGDCAAADPIEIAGPEETTKPGGYQYTGSGGLGGLTWSVSGSGATISEGGYLTLDESACGSITVTVSDSCGVSASMSARVTNNGHWVNIETCPSGCKYFTSGWSMCVSGSTRRHEYFVDGPQGVCGSHQCEENCGGSSGCPPQKYCTYDIDEWQCL